MILVELIKSTYIVQYKMSVERLLGIGTQSVLVTLMICNLSRSSLKFYRFVNKLSTVTAGVKDMK